MYQIVDRLCVFIVETMENRCMCKFTLFPGFILCTHTPTKAQLLWSGDTVSLAHIVQRGDATTPTGKLLMKYTVSV